MKKQMSEKQKLVRAILFFVGCLLAGGCIGWGISAVTDAEGWDPAALVQSAAPALSVILGAVFVLLNAGMALWSWRMLKGCAARAAALDPDDEDELDALEERLGMPLVVTSVMQVVDMALFPVLAELAVQGGMSRGLRLALVLVGAAVFLAALGSGFAVNKKCVDLEKQLNPEKKGSLLDVSFQKTWMASCDEAQKQLIHEAGFTAFRTGSTACSLVWLVSVLLMFLLDTGVVPVLCVCAVWLTMQVSYFTAASRLEHGHR